MKIGIVGLPNKGKSTLFNALTSAEAKTANYPFTTITPNQGIAFASAPCPHARLHVTCNPNNSRCENGTRKIPINIIDVAGLVEGAHEGKGMGNQFLADVAPADCLVLVADASGGTDDEGNPCSLGTHDVVKDVETTLKEIDHWMAQVLQRNAQKAKGKTFEEFAALLSGVRVTQAELKHAYAKTEFLETRFSHHTPEEYLQLAEEVRKRSKPLVIAANKADSLHAKENVEKLKEAFPELMVIPTAADAELSLKKAQAKGWIRYDANGREGNETRFEIVGTGLDPRVLEALERIRHVLEAWNGTGVQELVNHCTFSLLQQIVLYPVEDDMHYSNHFGNVLPDAILLTKGSTAVQLAERIHTDLAKGFLHALDAETKMRIGKETPLHDGQIVKIVSAH